MECKVLYNGNIITVDEQNQQAEAMAIVNGRIADVGTAEELLASYPDGEQVNLQGKTVLPGFIDGHGHVAAYAQNKLFVDLTVESGVTSLAEVKERMKVRLAQGTLEDHEWLMGNGYDQAHFGGVHPTKVDLDEISTEIPIVCIHASGHVAVANSLALEKLGYGKGCPDPDGGKVVRFAQSDEPNGVLEETAIGHPDVLAKVGLPSPQKLMNAIKESEMEYAAYGITTAQDANCQKMPHAVYLAMAKANEHIIDIVSYPLLDFAFEVLPEGFNQPWAYDNHYRVGGAKNVLDGSPQAKTAWLTKPYHVVPDDLPADYCGYPMQDEEELYKYFKKCIANKWQNHIHCNGDAAADQFIRLYERALAEVGCDVDLRPVMVHCQTVREDQLDKMKELGILPTFFVDHVYYWGDWHYESVLGPERANRISPVKSAINRGMNYTLHQDPPVRQPNMIFTIHNAVNRKTEQGRVLGEDQRLTVMEAIKGITINGAYQCFEEKLKGSITPGKYADLVILDRNPLEVPVEQLKDIQVVETIKEGVSIYPGK